MTGIPLKAVIHGPRGTVSILDPQGRAVLPQFWLEFETMEGTSFITCQSGFVRGGKGWSCALAGGKIRLDLALDRPRHCAGILLSVSLHNLGEEPLALKSTRMMRARIPAGSVLWGSPDRWRVLKMGYTFGGAHREEEDPRNSALVSLPGRRDTLRSWGMTAIRFSGGKEAPSVGSSARRDVPPSGSSTRRDPSQGDRGGSALQGRDLASVPGGGLVLGFTTSRRQMSWIDLSRDGDEADISAVGEAEGIVVAPGRSMKMETLYAGLHDDLLAGLKAFGRIAGEGMKVAVKQAPNGWCSWHSYRDRGIGERTVLENADFLRERHKELPLRVVQLDDGYQKAYGDWLEHSDRFPHGVEWLAGEITARGLVPGIWVAPFTLHARSVTARDHPDWLVKDMTGKPLAWEVPWAKAGDVWHALDASHPEAQAWLAILFGRLYLAGYRYFKLDFLFMGCVKGSRAAVSTRVEAFRTGLTRIREAVRNSYILACTAPYQPCAGLVDGIRVSHDINPGGNPLESFMEAARETSQRFWAHGSLWNTDPDAVILRPEAGMPPPAVTGSAASVMLSGGGVFSGDALPVLGIDRLALLSGILKQGRPVAGMPLDLFERDRPRFVSQDLGRDRHRLAIFNFSVEKRTISFDLARLGLRTAAVETLPGFGPAISGRVRGRILTPAIPPGGVIVFAVTG